MMDGMYVYVSIGCTSCIVNEAMGGLRLRPSPISLPHYLTT
jgi:hypothetical protein